MSISNPSAAGAATLEQPPHVQQLVALLASLMPLLLRFQSHTVDQPTQAGVGSFVLPDPTLDHQAAVNLVGDITADALRNLSAYLETHAGRHAGLENCIPIVTQAARSFAARDYTQAFNLIWQAYRVIAMVRATDPQLPPVRPGGLAADSSTTSIH